MKLPGWEDAYVPSSKLGGYLLSETHPIGRWKARFFRALGFDETNRNLLEERLIAIAHSEEVQDIVASDYGVKYTVDGLLQGLTGRVVRLRTVWIIDVGEARPRFVTAYPI